MAATDEPDAATPGGTTPQDAAELAVMVLGNALTERGRPSGVLQDP